MHSFHGKRPFSNVEIKRIMTFLSDRKYGLRDSTLFLLNVKFGYRIHELLSLKIKDAFTEQWIPKENITVERKNMKGKTYSRTVVVGVTARKQLEAYGKALKDQGYNTNSPLFASSTSGEALRVDSWCKSFARMAKALGMERVGTHSCRKTYAKNIYENCGNDIMETKAALGHASVATTQQYLSYNIGRKAAAYMQNA